MSAALDPGVLFNAAGIGMLLHLACSVMLRTRIGSNESLFAELFDSPVLGDFVAKPWLLRGKYFLPWVEAPSALEPYSSFTKALFWRARLGAFLLIGGFTAFLLTIFWQVGHT
jgi:hypothetical protein